jgi:hypothetical protein
MPITKSTPNVFSQAITPLFTGGASPVGQNAIVARDNNGDCQMRRLTLGSSTTAGVQNANDSRVILRSLGQTVGEWDEPALEIRRNPAPKEEDPGYDWNIFVRFYALSGASYGDIRLNDAGTLAYTTTSDYRAKENISQIDNALAQIAALKVYEFNFIADTKKTKVKGFLAHEVQEIVPESVSGKKDQVDAEGNPVFQGIDQSKLVPLLVAAVKELSAEVASLKAQLNP